MMNTLLLALSVSSGMVAPLAQGGVRPPPKDEPVLDALSRKAVNFFWEQSHSVTGFTKDRANNAGPDGYYVASAASTGFALASYSVGVQRRWLSRSQAITRSRATLSAVLTKWPNQRGWLYHFINWSNGARVWSSEVSSIDTAIFLAGAIVNERYFKDAQITASLDAILGRIDWSWMLTNGGSQPGKLVFSHGWKPESGFLPYDYGDYSEANLLYILGLGASSQVPAGVWPAFRRQSATYKGIELITGGPLFIHQMGHVFVDYKGKRDPLGYNYWNSSRNATLANRQYCIDNPKGFQKYGPLFWGLSASDGPDGYKAYGAPVWGEDDGTIAPSSSVASLMFTPKESSEAAIDLFQKYSAIYGRYGFANGYNPTRSWIDTDVIGIDLGMMLLGIENYRSGTPNRLAMSHPIFSGGMDRAGFVTVNEPPEIRDRVWYKP